MNYEHPKMIFGYPLINFLDIQISVEYWISIIRFLDMHKMYFMISINRFLDIQK